MMMNSPLNRRLRALETKQSPGKRVHVITIRRGDDEEAKRQEAALIASGEASPHDLFVIINKFVEPNS